jgi:hypothetical protein
MIFSPSLRIFKKNLQENFLFCLHQVQVRSLIAKEPVMIINRLLKPKTCVSN